jgi:urease accessory protein
LELAVHQGWVDSEQSLSLWLDGLLQNGMATLDLPLLTRMHRAWTKGDENSALALGKELLAWRDCAEARLEERQMGGSLAKVLVEAGIAPAKRLITDESATYLGAFALACSAWSIPEKDSLLAFSFSWAESQVTAGVKLIPLGQTAGQRVLARMMVAIDHAVQSALEHADEELFSSTPGRSLAQLLHAGQDVRLFRS